MIGLSTHFLQKVWTIVLCQEFPLLLFSEANRHTFRQHLPVPLIVPGAWWRVDQGWAGPFASFNAFTDRPTDKLSPCNMASSWIHWVRWSWVGWVEEEAWIFNITLGDLSAHWTLRIAPHLARKELSLNSNDFVHENYTNFFIWDVKCLSSKIISKYKNSPSYSLLFTMPQVLDGPTMPW